MATGELLWVSIFLNQFLNQSSQIIIRYILPGPGGGWPAAPGAAEASQPPDGAERP